MQPNLGESPIQVLKQSPITFSKQENRHFLFPVFKKIRLSQDVADSKKVSSTIRWQYTRSWIATGSARKVTFI